MIPVPYSTKASLRLRQVNIVPSLLSNNAMAISGFGKEKIKKKEEGEG